MLKPEHSPLYVVIAGQGGSGKEGAAIFVAEQLETHTGKKCIVTREPSDNFRSKVFKANATGVSGLELAKMFYTDGAEVENNIVKPALCRGEHVVSVRARESTFAYQIPKGISKEEIIKIHNSCLGDFGPDLVIYLCLSDPEIGQRRKNGQLDGDTFDMQEKLYHQAVKKVYDDLAKKYSVGNCPEKPPIFGRWVTINADPPVPEVQNQIRLSLPGFLKLC